MKLWKYVAMLGGDVKRAEEISSSNRKWAGLDDWFRRVPLIMHSPDRFQIDFELPDDFVRETFKALPAHFYASGAGDLRSRKINNEDEEISAVEAFDRYGGRVIEEAWDKGSLTL
jgi:hypothetical protein